MYHIPLSLTLKMQFSSDDIYLILIWSSAGMAYLGHATKLRRPIGKMRNTPLQLPNQ